MNEFPATKPGPEQLRAIDAAFVLAVADATRNAILQRWGLPPPPPASVIDEPAEREGNVSAPEGLTSQVERQLRSQVGLAV